MSAQENGNGRTGFNFQVPTFGCKGCEDRKAIMGAGNWKMDAALFLIIVAGCLLFWKVKVA